MKDNIFRNGSSLESLEKGWSFVVFKNSTKLDHKIIKLNEKSTAFEA